MENELKSSGFGKASFVLSLVASAGFVGYWVAVYAAVLSKIDAEVFFDQNISTWGAVIFTGLPLLFICGILSIIFGILGARKANTKKGLAIAGLSISITLLVIFIGVMLWATKI